MDATLYGIRRAADGLIELTVALDSGPPRVFRATYDNTRPGYVFCNFDQELFTALSDRAFRRFGNCAVYQHELTKLVGAFCAGTVLPTMPVELGTTKFCTLKPSPSRVICNKLWILLMRLGLYRPRTYSAPKNEPTE
jgi:hypothetical protein